MEPENKKVNVKRLLITIGIVLVTALAFGGSTYYVLSTNTAKEKEATDRQIAEMQEKINDLQKDQAIKTDATETTVGPTAGWITYSDTTHNFSFKHPAGLEITPSKTDDAADYYMLLINKAGVIDSAGVNTQPDTSSGYISVRGNTSGGAPTSIAGLTANFSTATTPMGYTYHAYEFSRDGRYYYFRMNDYNDGKFITLGQFKTMVGSFKFN